MNTDTPFAIGDSVTWTEIDDGIHGSITMTGTVEGLPNGFDRERYAEVHVVIDHYLYVPIDKLQRVKKDEARHDHAIV